MIPFLLGGVSCTPGTVVAPSLVLTKIHWHQTLGQCGHLRLGRGRNFGEGYMTSKWAPCPSCPLSPLPALLHRHKAHIFLPCRQRSFPCPQSPGLRLHPDFGNLNRTPSTGKLVQANPQEGVLSRIKSSLYRHSFFLRSSGDFKQQNIICFIAPTLSTYQVPGTKEFLL